MNIADERRSARANVVMSARVEWHAHRVTVRIKNLSAHGAFVLGSGIPAAETEVDFHCNGRIVPGWIAWSRKGAAGIGFDEPVEPEQLHWRYPFPHPQIVKDTRVLSFKRPGFRGKLLTDEEEQIVDEWHHANARIGS